MLQPEEIQKITFEQSVFSGYKKEDVDAFLDKMYDDYSRLYNENAELVEKLKVCVSKIEEYRQDEKFLKAAIVNAQKLNETAEQELELKKQQIEEIANKKADEILADAQSKAQKLTEESNQKIADTKEKNAREFAQQQLENANLFAAKMHEYDVMIQQKQGELDALINKIDEIRTSTISLFEQQIGVISSLPQAEKTDIKTKRETPQVLLDEQDELIENDDEPISTAPEADDEPVMEQMDIEELIEVKPSPVEPEAPVLNFEDEVSEENQTEQEEFHLFGENSSLIFAEDTDNDDAPIVEEKSSRYKKKLKFGVDFDVKKDK